MVEERLTRMQQEAGRLDLNEVEDIVGDAVRRAGSLSTESRRDGRHVHIDIRLSSPNGSDTGARYARISTDGVEAFFIDLPDGISYQKFNYEREGQIEILRLLAALASEYLLGHFQEKEELRSLGRRRRCLEIAVDGDIYRLYQYVRWVSTREGKQ